MVIVGSKAGSRWQGEQAFNLATSPKELVVIDGATHMDLYDIPKYVDQVSGKMTLFFGKDLTSKSSFKMDQIKNVLLINTHLRYANWTEGTLNNAFHESAKDFFRSKSIEVLETIVEGGYQPEEEEKKHLESELVILQMPVNWFGAPWIYKKYVDEVFNCGLASKSF